MSSSRTDLLVDVTMPQMGVSVVEGTLVAWRVGVGDRVEADQTICEISTDKIVPVGTVLARVAVEGGAPADVVSAPPASAQPRSAAPVAAADNGSAGSDGRYYSPIVRRIAVAHGIDLSTVAGTGRGGRVRKQDVMAVVDGGGAAFAPAAEPPSKTYRLPTDAGLASALPVKPADGMACALRTSSRRTSDRRRDSTTRQTSVSGRSVTRAYVTSGRL